MTTPDGSFWELVKAEFRATWCGRWRWLWWSAAVGGVGWFGAQWYQNDMSFYWTTPWTLGYLYLTSLVLGSDLLSLGFRANPEPAREWPGRAYLARAVGRLAFILPPMAIAALIAHVSLETLFGLGVAVESGRRTALVVEGVQEVLHSLVLFSLAALMSAALRRPRRWVIAGLIHSTLLGISYVLFPYGPYAGFPMSLAYCLGAPLGGLVEEVSLALAALLGVDTLGIRWIEPAPFWISLPLELALIGLIAAAIGLIAARRCRKRPYSAAAKAIAASHPQ